MAIRDCTDPAVGKAGFAENTAHRVGRHRDREDVSKRSIVDDRDAKRQKVSARNHSKGTDAAKDRFPISQHFFEAFAIRRRPELGFRKGAKG